MDGTLDGEILRYGQSFYISTMPEEGGNVSIPLTLYALDITWSYFVALKFFYWAILQRDNRKMTINSYNSFCKIVHLYMFHL